MQSLIEYERKIGIIIQKIINVELQIQQGNVESSLEHQNCSHCVQLHYQTFEFHIPRK